MLKLGKMGVSLLWHSTLLMSVFLWPFIGGASPTWKAIVCPYLDWLCTTWVDFLHFLENVLWKAGDLPQFAFPVIRVLPGTLLRVLSRPPVPVQESTLIVPEIGPMIKKGASQEYSLEVLSVLLASLDIFVGLVSDLASPSCSPVPAKWPPLDSEGLGPYGKEPSSPSLVLGEASPTCSPDVFLGLVFNPSCSLDILAVLLDNSYLPPDDSYCLLEDSPIPLEKPCPDVEKGFDDLRSLAISLSELFSVGKAH